MLFASSFSDEAGSEELQERRRDETVEDSKLLSGLVSVSVRTSESSRPSETVISEIEVKDLVEPIRIDIPLKTGVQNPENVRCMYLNEVTQTW